MGTCFTVRPPFPFPPHSAALSQYTVPISATDSAVGVGADHWRCAGSYPASRSFIKEVDGDHMIYGLVPTEDHLSVLADVMDGVHMICGLVPTEDHLSVLADVMDSVHMICGLVPTKDHLSVLADVMDGVHMCNLPVHWGKEYLSPRVLSAYVSQIILFACSYVASFPLKITYPSWPNVTDGVQQPFHSFHEKTIALGWNFNDCGFIERDRVVFIDCHFVVLSSYPSITIMFVIVTTSLASLAPPSSPHQGQT
ncbi:hypothetical protein EDB84DRAFT_1436950 [Lactarius hengduanensis]|nr:hypothetical protein EDB84DRAFT_1436950 [Lactarius hengduanensis]